MIKAAVLGATGYTGQVLLRILEKHPEVTGIIPVSRTEEGNPLSETDFGLCSPFEKASLTDMRYVSIDRAAALKPDVIFSALPHLASGKACGPFFDKSVVIDLSADFRIEDPLLFKAAYGQMPPASEYQAQAVYGLAELYRERIRQADIIANPGCYPTCTLLPLMPVLKEWNPAGTVVINAISGISGAGKKAKPNLHFCTRTENAGAYAPGHSHRHHAEILKEGKKQCAETDLIFTPHLSPLSRGMCVTTAVPLKSAPSVNEVTKLWKEIYGESPFIRINEDRIPETSDVRGSNLCAMTAQVHGNMLMLFSAIDNLMKGASGQAVQNMNLRFGLAEDAGLSRSCDL